MQIKTKIVACLWFDDQAEAAAKFYTSIFKFNEAVSFQVMCDTQKEVDYFWAKLSEGGQEGPCGWLKDKFGLSWQVVPAVMAKLFSDKDPKKAGRAMQAMLKMKKLNIAELKRAAAGK